VADVRAPGVEAHASAVQLALALVHQSDMRVTLVLPRVAGVVPEARSAAAEAGVEVRVGPIGPNTISLRFASR
jgi:hypothetical protein